MVWLYPYLGITLSPSAIDGAKFCRSTATLTRSLGESPRLARLLDMGCQARRLECRVAGHIDDKGRAILTLSIDAEFEMQCQRCLEPMTWSLSTVSELELCADRAEIDRAQDDKDRIVASRNMDVDSMIEDEIILAIPMIPKHEVCEAVARSEEDVNRSPYGAIKIGNA